MDYPLLSPGPAGDIGIAANCGAGGASKAVAARLNGWGQPIYDKQYQMHSIWTGFTVGRHNEMLAGALASTWFSESTALDMFDASGLPLVLWSDDETGSPPEAAHFSAPRLDPLGNIFSQVTTPRAVSLDGTLNLPAAGAYLIRGGPAGESFYPNFNGSFVPDGQGGVILHGPLYATTDFGCGPVVPGGPSSSYIARLDSSWICVYSHALPTTVTVLPDAGGGVLESVTSSTALDLGCGTLPAAPAGSTFVTRLTAAGACVFAGAFSAPKLSIALDPADHIVLSGLVDAAPVDLGGGPLSPLGTKDFVIAELGPTGSYLWSKRVGGPGMALDAFTSISVATSGNLNLQTSFTGAADFGGGPVTAVSTDTVIASLSPVGAHRFSRALHIVAPEAKAFDGCGAFVVASIDPSFDVGCGPVLPPVPARMGVARFAP